MDVVAGLRPTAQLFEYQHDADTHVFHYLDVVRFGGFRFLAVASQAGHFGEVRQNLESILGEPRLDVDAGAAETIEESTASIRQRFSAYAEPLILVRK